MHIDNAIQLIEPAVDKTAPSVWVDLGCGSGFFTQALASLLFPGSTVEAVDVDAAALSKISNVDNINIKKRLSDFHVFLNNSTVVYDGILMANALHFVPDQSSFLALIKRRLKSGGRLILVEYEQAKANRWVPFPLPFDHASRIGNAAGFVVTRLATSASAYNQGGMYAALFEIRTLAS